MADTKTSSGTGIGMVIFIVLFILKLMGEITLGWFWVITSFIWAPLLTILVIFGIALIIAFIIGGILEFFNKKNL